MFATTSTMLEPSVPASAPSPEPPPQIKAHLTLADILGEEHLLNLAFGPESSRTSSR